MTGGWWGEAYLLHKSLRFWLEKEEEKACEEEEKGEGERKWWVVLG